MNLYENELYKSSLVQTFRHVISVVTTSSALSGCQAEQLEFLVQGFNLHGSISEQYLFLASALETRVCQNPIAMPESRPSDVHIGNFCLFVWLDSLRSINNLMKGRVCLG